MKAIIILSVLTAGISSAQTAAGSGWSWQNSLPQGNPLRATAMLDANTVVAAGDAGTILRTTNGGATWKAPSSGTTNHLSGVFFTDANTGWVVGAKGTILHTTAGGEPPASQPSGGRMEVF